MDKFLKLDFKTIMIIGLVIVILLLQMCKGDKKDIKKFHLSKSINCLINYYKVNNN